MVLVSGFFGALSAFNQVQPRSSTSSLESSQLPEVTMKQSAIIYQMVGTVLNLLTLPQNLAEEVLDCPVLRTRRQAGEGLVTQSRSFSNEQTSWASSHSSIFYTAPDLFSLSFVLACYLLDQPSSLCYYPKCLISSRVDVGRRLCSTSQKP